MGNQVKHLLIILSILLLSSPVIGQSSKYESVSQCVLQTMEDRDLTGNKMFEMVREECERSLEKGKKKEKRKRGVLYHDLRNGELGYFKSKGNGGGSKYVGEIKNGVPDGQGKITHGYLSMYEGGFKNGEWHGQGTHTEYPDSKYPSKLYPNGRKYIGEWKDGLQWNGTEYDLKRNILWKFVNGKQIKP